MPSQIHSLNSKLRFVHMSERNIQGAGGLGLFQGVQTLWMLKTGTGCWVGGGTKADLGEVLKGMWEGERGALVIYCCLTILPKT